MKKFYISIMKKPVEIKNLIIILVLFVRYDVNTFRYPNRTLNCSTNESIASFSIPFEKGIRL